MEFKFLWHHFVAVNTTRSFRFKDPGDKPCEFDPVAPDLKSTVAARVTTSLRWILTHSKDGQCNKREEQMPLPKFG